MLLFRPLTMLVERIRQLPFFVDLPHDFDLSQESSISLQHCFEDLESANALLGEFDKSLAEVELLPDWWEPG